jgi:5'-nucleotidase
MSAQFEWILFDADETLFRFDSFSGLKLMLSRHNVDFTKEDFEDYEAVNKPLWVEYQAGRITPQELQQRRFDHWSKRLGVPSLELNHQYMQAMAEICHPLDGAVELLHFLSGKVKMGIITNGFSELQEARLAKTGLTHFFEFMIISEKFGVAKPDRRIFDHALELAGNPAREKVLMVGDNLGSDILGGLNADLQTCWFNPQNKSLPSVAADAARGDAAAEPVKYKTVIQPHYTMTSLLEIKQFFPQV